MNGSVEISAKASHTDSLFVGNMFCTLCIYITLSRLNIHSREINSITPDRTQYSYVTAVNCLFEFEGKVNSVRLY